MNKRIIGIDLAVTAKHKAMIFDPAKNEFIGRQLSFRSRPSDLERLLSIAKREAPSDLILIAILEATGMAWYPVATYLASQGVQVFRVNGQRTKEFRRAVWRHTGSDRIDSRILAQLYLIEPARLAPCPLPCGDLLTLQRACRAYNRWREQDVAEQNRMQAIDHWAWGGLEKLIPANAQTWMREHWYNPWRVRDAGYAALKAAWVFCNDREGLDTGWINVWVERAKEMTELYPSEELVGYDSLQETICHSLELRKRYKEEQAQLLQEKIQPLYTKLYPNCPLPSIRGVGMQSAATYRAFIQDIERFSTVEKFRRWCGIVPRSKQSGEAEAKGMALSKAGPSLVKATLYLNADVARQWDVQFAAIYHKQMVAYGKHHTQAVCACASHLASRIYAILKEQRPYQLRDLQGKPISAEASRKLCIELRVPENVRKRKNKRFRRNRAEEKTEARLK